MAKRTWRISLCLLLSLMVMLPGSLALADKAEAKHHFDQGVALYNDGNYNAALAEFQAALRLYPQATQVHYNIGLTEKGLFHYQEAIEALQRYLNETPSLPRERRSEVERLIAEMNALLADIQLDVRPEGAQVMIDGRQRGTTPLGMLRLAAGNHVIEVSAEGHKALRKEIMVTAGKPVKLTLALQAVPKTGKVTITSPVAKAEVSIDDKAMGKVPVVADLLQGGHLLLVTAKGYAPYRGELVVVAGQERTVPVVLDKPQGKFYTTWWFWTTIGVVAGGAAAAAIAIPLSRGPDPIVGTLAPGIGRVN